MTVTLPEVWTVSITTIVGAVLALVAMVWAAAAAYGSVMRGIAELRASVAAGLTDLQKDLDRLRERTMERDNRSTASDFKLTELDRTMAVLQERVREVENKLDQVLRLMERGVLLARRRKEEEDE
jgi:hypothetical protein